MAEDAAHDNGAGAARWLTLARHLGLADAEAEYALLSAAYEGPGRHYHTLRHAGACLNALDTVREQVPDADIVALALWYHDVVYQPGRSDNEAVSAARGVDYVIRAGRPDLADDLHRLVMVTVHPSRPAVDDERWMVDLDLGILGQSWPVFERFERDIRAEYQHVPEAAFRARRQALLQTFLDAPRLYHTEHFHALLDSPARANLQRAIAVLREPPSDRAPGWSSTPQPTSTERSGSGRVEILSHRTGRAPR